MSLASVLENIEKAALRSGRNPQEIKLVAVTKERALEDLLFLYKQGVRDFGESRVQEFLLKLDKAPQEARFHFIGTLQKNKVQKVIGKCALIHSVDTFELAHRISHLSQEASLKTPILLQVNTSGELSKHGLSPEGWRPHLESLLKLPHLDIQGFMTMAPLTENQDLIRSAFRALTDFGKEWGLQQLSMGMSGDYEIAIEEGATLVRVGRALYLPSNFI